MECPVCHAKDHIDVDTHADGFAANLQECGHCGAVWTNKNSVPVLIYSDTLRAAANG
jgi:transcription elongation factor Elf1